MQVPNSPHTARPSAIGFVVVLLAFATALFAVACVETRFNRALKTPDQAQTLDHRSPYLTVHLKDGQLIVLSAWRVDDVARRVARGSPVTVIDRDRLRPVNTQQRIRSTGRRYSLARLRRRWRGFGPERVPRSDRA